MVSMNRPSRALRESVTTIRYVGRLVLPRRASLIAVAIGHLLPLARVPKHLERFLRHTAGSQLLHHLLHLFELGQQLVHGLYIRDPPGGDAPAPAPVDQVGMAALLRGHGGDDSLDLVEGTVIYL